MLFVERDKSTFSARSPGCSLRLCVSQSTFRTKIILLITPVCVSKSTYLSRDQIVHVCPRARFCSRTSLLIALMLFQTALFCTKCNLFTTPVCVKKHFLFFLQRPACPLSMYVLKSTFLAQRPACLLRLCVCFKVVLPQISASLYYVCVKEYVFFFLPTKINLFVSHVCLKKYILPQDQLIYSACLPPRVRSFTKPSLFVTRV